MVTLRRLMTHVDEAFQRTSAGSQDALDQLDEHVCDIVMGHLRRLEPAKDYGEESAASLR